jgi:hypothetical protein
VYDPACDQNNEHSQDSEDSEDEQGHNSGARPEAKDPNPGEEEESKEKEESSAPGAVKAGEEVPGGIIKSAPENNAAASDQKEAVSASDEAGQLANSEPTSGQLANSSPTTYGCPFDYEYDEKHDMCFPTSESLGFYSILSEDKPWPDSIGGYVALLGHAPADFLKLTGAFIVQLGLDPYVGDALVDYGEDVFSPVGYGIQGLGYTVGFAGEVGGLALEGAGELVGAVSDGVEVAVDTVLDNTVYPVLEHVVEGVEAVVETVEKIGSGAKKIFCKFFC